MRCSEKKSIIPTTPIISDLRADLKKLSECVRVGSGEFMRISRMNGCNTGRLEVQQLTISC
jgi:hypothetical protein